MSFFNLCTSFSLILDKIKIHFGGRTLPQESNRVDRIDQPLARLINRY